MEIEYIISRTLSISIDIFAVLTAIFAVLLVHKLWKKPVSNIKGILVKVFSSLAIGSILFAVAEIWWEIVVLSGSDPALGTAEIFWIAGILFFILGYGYFTFYMYKEHQKTGKGIILTGAATIIAGSIVYFLITNYIFGYQSGETTYEIFLDYFYPITSAIILVLVIAVFMFFKDIGNIGKPLLLLAIGSTFSFLADMLYTYYSWNEIYGIPGILSDSFYSTDYLLSAVAFYMLWRMGMKKLSKNEKGDNK